MSRDVNLSPHSLYSMPSPMQTTDSNVPPAGARIIRNRRRRLAYCLISLSTAYMLVECFSLGLLYFRWGGFTGTREEIRSASAGEIEETIDSRFEVVHPFLGYVMHIDNADYDVQGLQPYQVNDFGLYDSAPPIRRRSEGKVLVAITGGSVAHEFSVLSSDALASELTRAFPGRSIEFVRLGVPGYKQPQQLMILTYVLSLGGELDVVINLDGFNEIALPAGENVPHDVFAAFPRSWQYRVVTGNDLALMRAIGLVAFCRGRRVTVSKQMSAFDWSPTALVVWKARNAAIDSELKEAFQSVARLRSLNQGFCASGPQQDFGTDAEMFEHLAQIWGDSSLQMHRLCRANGIEYYHFLQPTRHFPETDVTDSSRPPNDHIPGMIQKGYPLLQQKGEWLQSHDVAFVDLSAMFPPLQEGIYVDFCHLNKAANDDVAAAIANVVVENQE